MIPFGPLWSDVSSAPYEVLTVSDMTKDGSMNLASIDSADSVIYNMGAAVYTATHVSFPVYFNSDDLIYAFDYSFKYDHTRLSFDTIILAPAGSGLLAYSYYNPNDSVVRFTSSNLVAINNGVPIAYLHFDFNSGITPLLDSADLFSLKGYLNGDACSEFIVPPTTVGLNENLAIEWELNLFPVPANDNLYIKLNREAHLSIRSLEGKVLYADINLMVNVTNSFNVQDLPAGVYIAQISANNAIVNRKFIVSK